MMVKVNAVMLVIFLSMSLYVRADPQIPDAFVADAGSSGTRLFAFNWPERIGKYDKQTRTVKPPQSRPKEIAFPDGVKTEGDSKLAAITSPETAQKYVNELKEIALKLDGVTDNSKIPIYIKATAGMRLLNDQQIKTILTEIGNAFNGVNVFKFEKEHLFVTSGTEEAIYDWLSVNYLKEALKKGNDKATWGALDLGGASTQIAFVPDPPTGILNNWASVRPFDHTFRLYAVSHLGYGADQIELQIAKIVRETLNNKNPCLFKGAKKLYSINGDLTECKKKETEDTNCKYQYGTGQYNDCKRIIKQALALDNTVCKHFYKEHCSINGVYIPSLPADMKWVAFSAFYHVLDKKDVSMKYIANRGRDLCAVKWAVIIEEKCKDKEEDTKEYKKCLGYKKVLCFRHIYVHTLLVDGYHFDENKKIQIRDKIKVRADQEEERKSGWQWGSILYDANLLPYKVMVDGHAKYKISRAKSEYRGNYMDAENEIYEAQGHSTYDTNDGNGYYHQMIPLLLTVSVIFMMVIICIYCICGLGVIGFYSFCCYYQYNKATSDQQHIDIESL